MDEYANLENMPEDLPAPRLSLDIRLDEAEIFACLMHDSRRIGKVRLWVQSGLLLLMAAYWLIAFFTDSKKAPLSLVLAITALGVLAAMWVVPPWQLRRQARLAAEDSAVVRLRLYEHDLVFDGDPPVTVPLNECFAALCGELLIIDEGQQLIGVPRRVAGDEEFALLLHTFGIDSKVS